MTGRHHRDPRREKARDLRRLDAGRLRDIFIKQHPEYDWRNFNHLSLEDWRVLWRASDRAWDVWVCSATGRGAPPQKFSASAPPASFRRDLNRLRRARERQAIREQLARGGDVSPPRHRRDARWLWW